MIIRNRYLPFLDILLILLSAAVSFSLRFDTLISSTFLRENWFFAPLLVLIRIPLFYAFGLYRRMWRYASVNDLVDIFEAVLIGSVLAAMVVLGVIIPLRLTSAFPRSVLLIDGMLTLLMIGGLRFSNRLTRYRRGQRRSVPFDRRTQTKKRVVIFGAGDAGAMIVREMRGNATLGLEPVGFLDDDPSKQGLRLHDVPVLGDRKYLAEVVRAHSVDGAIIAIPTAPGHVIREITAACRQVGVPVKTIPGLYEILGGSVKVSAIREVELADLLRREPAKIDLEQVGRYLGGARVLVTGAGGSIGSELCRQIARFEPERLILFELSENNLYQIHRELRTHCPELQVTPVLGDIRNPDKVQQTWSRWQPQVVFHAAALKHVPLMESNVDEVVPNNIFGTRHVVEASRACGVKRFVFISTDKAVNPKSVMGATKRIGELLVQEASDGRDGTYVAVRFGNVLGSSGSVVPLFKEQIAAGGPVTVTHPEIRRYFMTIPEAVSLIIQSAAMGVGGEIFVLDMGEPVRIRDLAEDLIRLSGFEPGQDIEIVYTGLRPGEKLNEELFTSKEQCMATKHQQILIAKVERCDGDRLRQGMAELERVVPSRDAAKIKATLREIVPEYSPETHT